MTKNAIRRLLYWAVIEHHRTWTFFDGPVRERIANSKTSLNGFDVLAVALEYNAIKGIVPNLNTPHAIAKSIRDLADRWPDSLRCRAKACIATASALEEGGHTGNRQRSMVSKLIWFLRPRGWAMSDKYACCAFGIEDGGPDGMLRLYRKLEGWHFSEKAHAVSHSVRRMGLEELDGERVLDKFFWLVGARAHAQGTIIKGACYLASPSAQGRYELHRAAKAVAKHHSRSLTT